MAAPDAVATVDAEDIAAILTDIAALFAAFHQSDKILQDVLSDVTKRLEADPNMFQLQHIDVLTQTHDDLAKLLPALASCLMGQATTLDDLRATMTLRSLQDKLISPKPFAEREPRPPSGELSLF